MCLTSRWPMRARYWVTQWVWPVGTMGANDLRLCGDGPVSVSRSAPSRQHLTVILQSKCKCPSSCYNCKVSPRFEGQSFYWGQFDNDKETWDLRFAGANYKVFFPPSWLTSDIMRCAGITDPDIWPMRGLLWQALANQREGSVVTQSHPFLVLTAPHNLTSLSIPNLLDIWGHSEDKHANLFLNVLDSKEVSTVSRYFFVRFTIGKPHKETFPWPSH